MEFHICIWNSIFPLLDGFQAINMEKQVSNNSWAIKAAQNSKVLNSKWHHDVILAETIEDNNEPAYYDKVADADS